MSTSKGTAQPSSAQQPARRERKVGVVGSTLNTVKMTALRTSEVIDVLGATIVDSIKPTGEAVIEAMSTVADTARASRVVASHELEMWVDDSQAEYMVNKVENIIDLKATVSDARGRLEAMGIDPDTVDFLHV